MQTCGFSASGRPFALESDRAVVKGNVVSLMRDLSCVPYDCSDEDALATFHDIVQRTMPRVIHASLGLPGVRYELVSTISAVMLFASFDVTGGYIAGGFWARVVCASSITWLTNALAVYPLLCALCMRLCGCCVHLTGLADFFFTILVAIVVALVFSAIYLAFWFLTDRAMVEVLVLVSCVLSTLTIVVFRRTPGKQRKRRVGEISETMVEMATALADSRQLGQVGK